MVIVIGDTIFRGKGGVVIFYTRFGETLSNKVVLAEKLMKSKS